MASDASLVRRAQAGESAAFAALYQRHRDSVFRICRGRLRDEHLAEDATQETFLNAWRSLATVDPRREFAHWLYRVASNHCHDVVARNRVMNVELTTPQLAAQRMDPAAEEAVTACVERLALRSALSRLGHRDARLLVQRHLWDVPVKTMAAGWSLTKSSMEMALHRARTRARRCAKAEGLPALLPLALVRRVSSWLQRLSGDLGGISGVATATAYQMAIVVAVVAAPTGGSSGSPSYAVDPPTRSSTDHVSSVVVDGLPAVATAITHVPESARRPSRSTSGKRAGQRPQGPVAFDEVGVPGTDHRIHQSPSGEPRQSVGVRVETEDQTHDVEVEWYDDAEELRTVGPAACEAAVSGDPVTYCKRRR